MADGKVRVDAGQGWLMITLNGTVGPGVSCKGVATTCRTNPYVKPILVMSVKETWMLRPEIVVPKLVASAGTVKL